MSEPRIRKDLDTLSQGERDTLHGNVLFPTWHWAYLLRLENALRSAPGCSNVALPYWNEMSDTSLEKGLPFLFTQKDYKFKDGKSDPNPLFSYKLQKAVHHLKNDGTDKPNGHTKPQGYDTEKTREHNVEVNQLPPGHPADLLNDNVKRWLNPKALKNHEGAMIPEGASDNYKRCLDAPNYTNVNVKAFANGDMGENDTAAFDPVFYLHHCYIDRMFWAWQNIHNKSKQLDIIPGLKGMKNSDEESLTIDTPLNPFTKEEITPGETRPMTSNDVTNIVNLGYDYHVVDSRLGSLLSIFPDCDNCQNYLDIESHRKLYGFSNCEALNTDFYALVHMRANPKGIDTIEGNRIQTKIATA
ncbi:hypothetical protein BDP55DRAFT_703767 [Colletotrichum godetiae]|uniref:Tyrosinase copper-binding domain-containing protein n=1 Tax=Colletotrichum godetiae TaxID=1209918 RepID=A0AAJ0AN06_9PEZI|nr:uncharacterized protein BDP55DRAFT_703767 [Colletotrichum godetiae]KAK1676259.1 hypothetical protein BDP55DRAFT_703767 [Colletotrichum godetiae]